MMPQVVAPVAGRDPEPVPAVTVFERTRDGRMRLDVESTAIIVAAALFVVTVVVAAVVFWGQELAIGGRDSLGEFAAVTGSIAAGLAFLGGRLVASRFGIGGIAGMTRARFLWFDLIALTVAHAAIALIGWIGATAIMERSFPNATVYASPAAVLAAAAVSVSGYAGYLSGVRLSQRSLSLVLGLFLVVGIFTAMLTADDPQWWQANLSALGMTHDLSALSFNVTLIVSGVIVTTIARFGTATLPVASPAARRRRAVVRTLFVLVGVLLAGVGLFPVDRFFLLHNTVATGTAVAFTVLALGAPWLLPTMPKAFLALGFVFVAGIAGLALLFAAGDYTLTAVELIAGLLIFAWIILFLRNVGPGE